MKVLRTAAIVVGAVATVATFGAALGPTLGLAAGTTATLSSIATIAGIGATSLPPVTQGLPSPRPSPLGELRPSAPALSFSSMVPPP